jgi:sugar-specific transcriptional regulator TrmB
MMDDFFHYLDLDEKQVQVFLGLLKSGSVTVSRLAKVTGVPRSSMYFTVEALKAKGLLEEFEVSGVKRVKAAPVKAIGEKLKQKQEGINRAVELFSKTAPELEKMQKRYAITPKCRFYESAQEVQRMYAAVLEEDGWLGVFHPEKVKKHMPRYHYRIPDTIKERGLKTKELLVRCKEADFYRAKYESPKHQIKLLPKGVAIASDIIITESKVYMVAYGEDQIVGTEIQSPELAQTQTAFFDGLWAAAA